MTFKVIFSNLKRLLLVCFSIMSLFCLLGHTSAYADAVTDASVSWLLGPIDPLMDLNELSIQVDTLQAYGIEPVIVLMPVYDNLDTETYAEYSQFLMSLKLQGMHFIIREPVVNLSGTYGKNRAASLNTALYNLLQIGIQADGILLEPSYEPDPKIVHRQVLLPLVYNQILDADANQNEDILKLHQKNHSTALLLSASFPEKVLTAWIDQLTDAQIPFVKPTNFMSTKSYTKLLDEWKRIDAIETTGLQGFLDKEENKIAGLNLAPESKIEGFNVDKLVQGLIILTSITVVTLLIMFLVNRRLRRKKHMR